MSKGKKTEEKMVRMYRKGEKERTKIFRVFENRKRK